MPVPRETLLLVLLEKDRLCSSVFGFLKVAQTNANKPIALLRTGRFLDDVAVDADCAGWRQTVDGAMYF